MSFDLVAFVVGGITYPLHRRDIEKYPDSFLSTAVKREWHDGKAPITIDRDGELFHYIYAYIVSGCLSKAARTSNDKALLSSICDEAEYFGLPTLAEECAQNGVISPLRTYDTIRSFIETAKQGELSVEHPTTRSFSSPLLVALGSLRAPLCLADKISSEPIDYNNLYQSSTACDVNVAELIANAVPSYTRGGTEAVLDSTVCDSLEISADKMETTGLLRIEQQFLCSLWRLCPHPTYVKPNKLVVHQKGEHSDQHRDTVRADGHIGTVVVILNSEYTGGELEVTHGGRTEAVTGPYNWVAMYGDCLRKVNPVTSGTRVSLIYDIYGGHKTSENAEEDEDDIIDAESDFWNYRSIPFDETWVRGADVQAIDAALDQELQKLDSVVICLQHLYPDCHVVPGFLEDADAVLYELLCETLQDHYEVEVVNCSIHLVSEDAGHVVASGNVFTSFGDATLCSEDETRLLVPALPDSDCLLDHIPNATLGLGRTQARETVYVVSGLQVRRRMLQEGLDGCEASGATPEVPGKSLKRKAGDILEEGDTQDSDA
jgi:hypothetical protein